jgi:hypothetical protein
MELRDTRESAYQHAQDMANRNCAPVAVYFRPGYGWIIEEDADAIPADARVVEPKEIA